MLRRKGRAGLSPIMLSVQKEGNILTACCNNKCVVRACAHVCMSARVLMPPSLWLELEHRDQLINKALTGCVNHCYSWKTTFIGFNL